MQAMQAQNLMWAPALATAVASVANVGINVLLIRWYGFHGAAAAYSVTRLLLFLLLAGTEQLTVARLTVRRSDLIMHC